MVKLKTTLVVILLASIAFALLLGYSLQTFVQGRIEAQQNLTAPVDLTQPIVVRPDNVQTSTVSLALPAVDKLDNGVLGLLEVEATTHGKGAVYVRFDASTPLINPDTQTSLRTAIEVAKTITGSNGSKIDLYYGITSNSDLVGGQSAGTAMTVATLALLTGTKLRKDVAVTGTILEDGTIGPVGKILQKATAVKKAGFKVFLVPTGESIQRIPKEYCKEETVGNAIFRNCQVVYEEVNVTKEVGIDVFEVATVGEAFARMKVA